MSSVDSRVVEMQFDNSTFGKGVSDSLKDLDNLKKGLKLDGAADGINKVADAANGFSTEHMANALDNISSKFSALGAIGFTIIQRLTDSAINFGKNAFSSILDPIISGGETRAHNIEQAKFQFEGLGMNVEAMMKSALDAVRGTAYGLDSAAKTAAQFGASGIKAGDQMTGALRGVAGLAAMTGSSFDDVSQIFTTVAGNGRLMSENLLQFSSRGINVAATLAKSMGKTEAQIRDMVTHGKIDFQTFASTMDKAFGAHAKDANKTYSGSLDNLHAAMSRIGADFATPKFAGLRDIFNALGPAIDKVHAAIKPVIDLYGQMQASNAKSLVKFINGINFDSLTKSMPLIADTIKNVFTLIGQVIKPIKDAFQQIFPPTSTQTIVKIATAIDNFSKKLLLSSGTMAKLKQTFAGVFAVVDIFIQIIKAAVTFVGNLFQHFSTGQSNISGFTSKVGTAAIMLDKFLKAGDYFNKFFAKLEVLIEKPIDKLKELIGKIVDFVKAVASTASAASIIGKIRDALSGLGGTGDHTSAVLDKLKKAFEVLGSVSAAVFTAIGHVLKKVLGGVGDFIKGISFGDIAKAAGLTGLVLIASKIHKEFLKVTVFLAKFKSTGTFIQNSLTRPLEKLTGTLVQMTKTLKYATLLEIAAAILVLTIAVSTLSKIDAVGLMKATVAIGFMMAELVGAMKLMDVALRGGKGVKMVLIAAGMVLLATAVDILASAVKKLADLSWTELATGLSGVVVLLGALAGAMRLMPTKATTIKSALGIVIIAEAIKILVSATKDMAAMSWGEIARGLTGVAALLTSLALYTKFSKLSSIRDGAGIVLMAAAIKILASAMKDISNLSWDEIARGLTGVAGGLISMSIAMKLMPEGSLLKGAAVVEVAAALKILASAMQDLSGLDWGQVGIAMTSIAGGLTAMVVALQLMPAEGPTLKNAASVVVIAAALKILASAMKDMAGLSWTDIGQAATALAGGLAVIVVALNGLKFDGNVSQAASLLIVTAAIKVLASAMQDLGGMTWSDIAAGLTALAGGMMVMVVALNSMDGTIPGALALLAATPGIAALASAMQSLGGMSWADIGAALVALGGGLGILAGGLYLMEGTLPGSLGLLAAAPGINALSSAMQNIGKMSWSDIGAALGALSGGLLALAVGLTAMIVALPGAAALKVAAPGLGDLAEAMQKAGSMSWSDIAAGVVGIGGALVALAVGLTAMIVALPGAVALAVAGPALGDFADAMKKIGAMSWSDLAAAAGGIAGFLTALAVGSTVSVAILALGGALAVLSPNLADFVSTVQNSGQIGGIVKSIAASLKDLASVDAAKLTTISTAADKLSKALPALNLAVGKGIGANAQAVVKAGADAANNFAKGITSNLKPSSDAGTKLVKTVNDAITPALQTLATSVSGPAQTIGKNIVDGVNVGVSNNQSSLNYRMRSMAETALAEARAALGIHSPSKKFQEIGQFVAEGFALGLTGRPEKVKSAVDNLVGDLMGKFNDAMQQNLDDISSHKDKIKQVKDQIKQNATDIRRAQADLNEAINTPITRSRAKHQSDRDAADAKAEKARQDRIKSRKRHLDDLTAKQDKYNKSIATEQTAINKETAEYNTLKNARSTLLHQLNDEQKALDKLTSSHDALNKKIDDQKQKLADITKTRDDYKQSIKDQYGQQADITKDTKVPDYIKNLQEQIVHTQQYATALQKLRKRGLNDEMYKMLLAKGPDEGMPFVQQLLDGSDAQLKDLNNLGKSLDKAANTLGDQASKSLYQAGVDAAAGILKGLQAQEKNIQAQMDKIAGYMVDVLKKKLGIKSPSRVFAELGAYTAQGLAKGLNDSSALIGKAAEGAGQNAIDAMKKTISGLGTLVSDNMDANPTIKPVLDLSSVKKDASTINDLLTVPTLSVDSVYAKANDAAAGYAANQAAMFDALAPAELPAPVSFTQINNSPKALSSAELYRQTNNQISVAKGALTTSARKS